jgi:hypothetical protein
MRTSTFYFREIRSEDGISSGSCPIRDFSISSVEPLGSANIVSDLFL